MSGSPNSNALNQLAGAAANLSSQFLGTGPSPSGTAGGGGRISNPQTPGGTAIQPTTTANVTVVQSKSVKMLTSKGAGMTHESIQEFYTSYRTNKFQDDNFSHVRLMDASVHKLLDLDFDSTDWRKMDSVQFFEQLLREYHAEANSSKATMEERFRNLDKK